MSAWFITAVDGIVTGVLLYGLVRLRMHMGPKAGDRFGVWGRRGVWIALIAAMLLVAEADLLLLRYWLADNDAAGEHIHYEAVFAALMLIVGLGLVFFHIGRRRADERRAETLPEIKQ